METIETMRIPGHIANHHGGNGRWAKRRLMERVRGHEKGSDPYAKWCAAAVNWEWWPCRSTPSAEKIGRVPSVKSKP